MLRGRWIAGLAFGLAVGCLASAQEAVSPNQVEAEMPDGNEADSAERARADAKRSEEITAALGGIEARISELEGAINQAETETERQRIERDLNAQERMAFWAGPMFWASFAMVFLTFGALVAIIRTLHHTRRAADAADSMNEEANAATRAALDTLAATKDIGERQLRPYIMYDSATLERWTVVGTEEIGYTAKIDFKNCGQNPGIIIAKSGTVYAPLGNGRWGSKGSAANKCRMVVGPGQTETLEFPTVRADDQGRITWFQIGVLILFENQHGDVFEEYVWLMYNGAGFSQAYDHAGRDLYRPEDWPEQPKD